MSKVEEKIRNNKKQFNTDEPADGHFERFQDKLSQLHQKDEQEDKFNNRIVWKIAASVIIILGISLVFLIKSPESNSTFALNATNKSDMNQELVELDNYYSQQTNEKLCEINKLCKTTSKETDFKEIVKDQVIELSDSRKELEKDYIENNDDERTFSAIVNNYRLLTKALDKIIETLQNNR